MQADTRATNVDLLRGQLRQELASTYGEMIGGDRLRHVLGFGSSSSLSMAIQRKTIDLATFRVNGRRGRFALTKEIADWLVDQRSHTACQSKQPVPTQFANKRAREKS